MSTDPFEPVPVEASEPPPIARAGQAPPTVQGQLPVRQQQARWPMVLGVIAVVFGVGGILTYGWGIVSVLFMKPFLHSMAQGTPVPQMPKDLIPMNVTFSALNMTAAALLLFAGILLLKRRRRGVKLTRIWASIKMLLTIPAAWVGYLIQERMWTAMLQQNPNMPQIGLTREITLVVSVVFALVWGWALPVFMLIFLARRRVREQCATWP